MAEQNKAKATAPAADKPKRKMPTLEERIAAAEAKAAELKAKAEERANKGKTEAVEKRAKLRDKLVSLSVQHNDLTEVIGDEAWSNVTIDAAKVEVEPGVKVVEGSES